VGRSLGVGERPGEAQVRRQHGQAGRRAGHEGGQRRQAGAEQHDGLGLRVVEQGLCRRQRMIGAMGVDRVEGAGVFRDARDLGDREALRLPIT
jgi:hypothetical protein